jgi:hypothetical protein
MGFSSPGPATGGNVVVAVSETATEATSGAGGRASASGLNQMAVTVEDDTATRQNMPASTERADARIRLNTIHFLGDLPGNRADDRGYFGGSACLARLHCSEAAELRAL